MFWSEKLRNARHITRPHPTYQKQKVRLLTHIFWQSLDICHNPYHNKNQTSAISQHWQYFRTRIYQSSRLPKQAMPISVATLGNNLLGVAEIGNVIFLVKFMLIFSIWDQNWMKLPLLATIGCCIYTNINKNKPTTGLCKNPREKSSSKSSVAVFVCTNVNKSRNVKIINQSEMSCCGA